MAIAPQAPATPATLTPEDLTTISCAANRLVGHFGYAEQDREDVEHDLTVDLLERLKDYNPAKAKRSTFAKDCVEHQISNMIRARGRQCRDPSRVMRINDGVDTSFRSVSPDCLDDDKAEGEQQQTDLRMDVATVLARLPQAQRDICALLPDHAPWAISQKLGLTKHEVYSAVEAIRAAFTKAGLGEGFQSVGKSEHLAG